MKSPPDKPGLQVRKANPEDLEEILELFRATVSEICKKDYSPDQIRIWVDLAANISRWSESIRDQYFLLAIKENIIAGFGSLDKGSHVDFLFTHKDHQGTGIASALLRMLENRARMLGSGRMTSDVSKTARSFFESHGFYVITPQSKVIDGIEISNFRMQKDL